MIGSFGLQEFSSISDAERVAGYHIPEPSADYPMGFDQTALRNLRGYRRPMSSTEYTYAPLAPTSIGLVVAPSYDWSGSLAKGTNTLVGGHQGWLMRNDAIAITFAFTCGTVDGVDVWCVVRAPAEVGLPAVDDFVASVH